MKKLNTCKTIGHAVVIGMFICHSQVAQAGWTGLINGVGFGWGLVKVTSVKGTVGATNTPNVNLPTASMAPAPGFTYTRPLPAGSSGNTSSQIKGKENGIWLANAVGVNGDKADSGLPVSPATSDASTTLEVLSITSVTDASCGPGQVLYTFTWHWTGSDAGTDQRIAFYEIDGTLPPAPDLSILGPDFLGGPEATLLAGPFIGSQCVECEGPGFDDTPSVTTICATSDPSKIYIFTQGTAESLFFNGFLPPIGGADATGGNCNAAVRQFKLGSTIPVKMTLNSGGLPATPGKHTLWLTQCGSSVGTVPAKSTIPTVTDNVFRMAGNQWIFNLSTAGLSAGTWELTAILYDGSGNSSQHSAYITLF